MSPWYDRQTTGDRSGVENGLRRTVGSDRIHRMSCVTEQRDLAERPAVNGIAIDHRKEECSRGRSDQRWNVEPRELPAFELRQEVGEIAWLVPILPLEQFGLIGAQLGNEVELLTSVGQVEQWIHHELLQRMACPHHRATIEDRCSLGEPAPQQSPVPFRHALVGVEVSPGDRVDAVAGDQRRARGDGACGPSPSVDECRLDALARLHETVEVAAGVYSVGADLGERRRMQDRVQDAAMNGDLRPPIARCQTPRFLPNRFAAFGEVGQRGRRQTVGGKVVGQAECVELADGVRQQVDAHAERLDPIDALEHPDRKAGSVQAQCRGQTTDPTAGDDDVVHSSADHRVDRLAWRR